jgi:hypothetical protein
VPGQVRALVEALRSQVAQVVAAEGEVEAAGCMRVAAAAGLAGVVQVLALVRARARLGPEAPVIQ